MARAQPDPLTRALNKAARDFNAREIQLRVGTAIEQHLGRPAGRVGITTQITPLSTTRRRVL